MAVEISLVCEESADAYSVQLLSIVLAVVFGLYILFDALLGAFTVGAKASELLGAERAVANDREKNLIQPKAFDSHIQ